MVEDQLFNLRQGEEIPVIYGVASKGWKRSLMAGSLAASMLLPSNKWVAGTLKMVKRLAQMHGLQVSIARAASACPDQAVPQSPIVPQSPAW